MKARSFVTAAVLAVLLAAGSARADDLAGKISIGVQVGTQSDVAGQVLKGGKGTLLGKPATVDAKRYRDVYKPDVRYQAFLGYGISAKFELVARGSYYENEAVGVAAGSFDGKGLFAYLGQAEDPNSTSSDLVKFPYKEYGAELALRFYFAPQSRLKSFIAPVDRWPARRPDADLAERAGGRIPADERAVQQVRNGPGRRDRPRLRVRRDRPLLRGRRHGSALPDGRRSPRTPASCPGSAGIDESDARWTAPVVAMIGARF